MFLSCKVQVFQEGHKKCGAIYLKVFLLSNFKTLTIAPNFWGLLRIYQLYLLWPFVQQKLGQIYRRYIPIGFCRISAGSISLGLPADSFHLISNLASLFFHPFFSAEQWKFLEKMVLVFNVKKIFAARKIALRATNPWLFLMMMILKLWPKRQKATKNTVCPIEFVQQI